MVQGQAQLCESSLAAQGGLSLRPPEGRFVLLLPRCTAMSELMPFIEKKVKVTGVLIEKNGMKAIRME